MRLWTYELIPYLPKSQLVAQWRELNSIFKKQDNHILINYIYNYKKEYLFYYTDIVLSELTKRHIKIKSYDNFNNYFKDLKTFCYNDYYIFKEHDNEYLLCNFFNLLEKYRRSQKDFDRETFEKLYDYVNERIDLQGMGIYK